MKFNGYGYQAWKFKPEEVRKVIERIHRALDKIERDGITYDALCVLPMSPCEG